MSRSAHDLSPWPQLSELFVAVEKKDDNNFVFKCMMCLPKEKVLSCSKATNSNLRKHLKAQHPTELDKFKRLLKKRKASLAATVSWLDPESLSRTTAVLTCRRMEGRIPYDRIADVLIESFDNFRLHGKVTKVVTDNGSNFVKAFRVLGQTELAADGHMEDNDATTDSIDLTTILNGASHGDVRVPLPPHHRCSAHTLNLVATVDASKAESCEMFSRPLCSVLRTCRQLWNRQGQSATAAEAVQRFCGRAFQRPVATRWNSLFDALTCLMELDNAGNHLDGLCRTLQIPPFQRPRDVLFIKEYCEVMKPVACAIDVVQRDDVYFGHLLPTITV
ncbi:uncharacterized protein LOC135392473 [Ornithodoros turicata]|uniref:uncharacterized protein LOC135392473 n=1 Tax=Ornithodoros turicata TaxID=34597 RepID=UPI0031391220